MVAVGSEEDTDLYFVATGELTSADNARGEHAKAGENNLYLLRYDEETKKWEPPCSSLVSHVKTAPTGLPRN